MKFERYPPRSSYRHLVSAERDHPYKSTKGAENSYRLCFNQQRGMILQHFLAVVCLAQSGKKQQNDGKTDPFSLKMPPLKLLPGSPKENPFADPEYYFDMERAEREEYEKNSKERSVHMLSEAVPIVFNDDHEFETNWDSGNVTTDDQCTYTTQDLD